MLSLCVGSPLIAGAASGQDWRDMVAPSNLSKTHQHPSVAATDTAAGGAAGKSPATSKAQSAGGNIIATAGASVCEINGVSYATLDDALTTITDSTPTTIELLANITTTNSYILTGRNITFDLNNFNLIINSKTDTALSLTNCNISCTNGGSFQVISGAVYDPNSTAALNGVGLFVDGGSLQATSVKATGEGAVALYSTDGAQVTITGSIAATGDGAVGLLADTGCAVTVGGNLSATSLGALISGSTLDVGGNVAVKSSDGGEGIVTMDFSEDGNAPTSVVKVAGNITIESTGTNGFAVGLDIESETTATLGGNVTVKADYGVGVSVDFDSTVTMTGAITASGSSIDGIDVYSGTVTLTGNITATGTGLYMEDGTVVITGAIASSGDDSYGLDVEGGKVSVTGNVKTTGEAASAVYADASTVTITGKVSATGADSYGIEAYDKAKVTVTGDVTGDEHGVDAEGRGTDIYIKGNIVAKQGAGVYADNKATVTVDGAITAPDYIALGSVVKDADGYVTPTTKAGYKTYTDNKSTVWVKDTTVVPPVVTPKKPPVAKKPVQIKTPGSGSSIPDTGDAMSLAAPGALFAAAAIAAAVITVVAEKRKTGEES